MKGNLNISADQDILDNCMLLTLYEQFGEDPYLFQHDSATVHKARSIKVWLGEFGVEVDLTGTHRALTSTPSNTFGMN